MRPYVIIRHCGISLLIVSVLILISALIALCTPSDNSFWPLAIGGLSAFICGLLAVIYTKPVNYIYTNEGYTIVLMSWITAWLFGALPYLLYGGEFTFVNSLFESMSGFTTTGASILNDIEALPAGMQFWRIASAWIGGIGVVLLITLAIPNDRNGQVILVSSETSSLAREYFKGGKRGFVRMMLLTYTSITIISFISLKLAGMDWFDAMLHAMSACSTCGFSNKNSSIAFFDNPVIETVLVLSMLSGAVNFTLLYSTIIPGRRKRYYILKSEVFRVFMVLLAIATLFITISLRGNHIFDSTGESFRQAVFQTVSIATTTGFATTDTNVWPDFCVGILIICSIICGCAGSTSGGIKIDRIVLISKEVSLNVHHLRDPLLITRNRVEGRLRKPMEINQAAIFVLMYFVFIFLGMILNVSAGMDLRSGISAAIACMGNVGPGFGDVSSFGNYSGMPDAIKMSSIVLMLAGRLEIYPLIIAFRRRI
ncbi:MAG: TrkH family potassium uptake protein [Bacteroidaceae bacterium]|nr:TrkH family potassium uptake protein [Bacteroidaceae bacterium]